MTGQLSTPDDWLRARANLQAERIEIHNEDALEAALATVPSPRSPDLLLEKLRSLGILVDDVVLDLGSGHGQYSVQIASAFGCRVIAVDLTYERVEETLAGAKHATAGGIDVACAVGEGLPLRDGSVQCIWSRDMLGLVHLPATLRECGRVLASGGHLLVYLTFATDLLEPLERTRLFDAEIARDNMDPQYFEATALDAGFTIVERDEVRGEWREWWEVEGSRKTSLALTRASILVRGGDALRARVGDDAYDFAMADQLWGIYQMIGKLCPTVYVLRKAG